ncbi:MarR family transcriptional regulator [Shewanella electrodiphila]|uniref:MarR family transcriptional regulator n=1 Tax=Shewanella electrodiphila TaxID=934143 RepID=A0ABT0KP16_9GAMM|nr:MarR family transcriptional regulator [Shewanella electrodiphila]MCL1045577.1 MarR family transcriptional regulator [Shewanella electrodiphila]
MSESLSALMALSSAFGRFNKKIDRALSVHGISFTEFQVLEHLAQSPNLMMSRIELAEATNLTASGITRLLMPMEKIHLIEKEKNSRDARVSLVKLTAAGSEIYQDAAVTSQNCCNSLTQDLTAKQVDQLHLLVSKLG